MKSADDLQDHDSEIKPKTVQNKSKIKSEKSSKIVSESAKRSKLLKTTLKKELNEIIPKTKKKKGRSNYPTIDEEKTPKKIHSSKNGFNKPLRLSAELSDLLGVNIESRSQVNRY
jgi:hypothetical protein